MFVGIVGDGRYEIIGSRVCTVEELAAELEAVADTGSQEVFGPVLATLIGTVRRVGSRVSADGHVDLLLPAEAAQLADVRRAFETV
jgi:hypothetical protein